MWNSLICPFRIMTTADVMKKEIYCYKEWCSWWLMKQKCCAITQIAKKTAGKKEVAK